MLDKVGAQLRGKEDQIIGVAMNYLDRVSVLSMPPMSG